MCDELVGTWQLDNPGKFDDYMKAIGVGFPTRKIACNLKPDVIISKNGDVWTLRTQSTFKNTQLDFELDKEMDETTADDRKCKTIFTLADGVLRQLQKWGDKETTIDREVKDGQMITTCTFGDVTCQRTYTKK
ncbi:myelin P2 protein-like [Hyperolius riggenbachi]|uniref:myelin P2 protein-like n=1 Tax=Hyperolius riggenbachi TaxID=752182 RepID=UPI0035A3A004